MSNPLRLVSPTDPPAPARRRRRLRPLVVDARKLAKLLSCGLRTIRTMDAAGRLPRPLRLGGNLVRWDLREIAAWLQAGAPDRATWEARRGPTRK